MRNQSLYLALSLSNLVLATDAIAQEIHPLSQLEQNPTSAEYAYSTSAKDLLGQQAIAPIAVTAIQVNPTPTGIEIQLQTNPECTGQNCTLTATTSTSGDTLIADIPNAVLSLPQPGDFRRDNPASGILSITATQLNPTTIRLSIVGETGVPDRQILPTANGLTLSITPLDPEEIQITVTATPASRYRVPNAVTATRTDTLIRDVPQSIQVIPREVLEDRQVVQISEIADNVSGVQPQTGLGGLPTTGFYIRGFSSDFESFRNGFRDFGFITPRDIANIEQIEILKGPASMLYGGGFAFSGVVNTVTKQPLSTPYYNATLNIGNYNFYRPTLDFSGPLTDNGEFLYRLNIAYQNSGSFRDFNENESIFVSPVVTWNISKRTRVTAEFEYQNYNYFFDRGLLPSREFLRVPIERSLGEPDFNRAEMDTYAFTYNFEHEFSDNWKYRQGFNLINTTGVANSARNSGFSEPFLEEDGRTLPRQADTSTQEQINYALQNEITGKFNTGSIRHNLLFGVELARYEFSYSFFKAPLASIDIFNPQYGAKPGEFTPSYPPEEYGSRNVGIYVQNLIELLPNLKLLAGLRYDSSDIFYRNEDKTINFTQNESEISPRLGLVYQPGKDTSLYVSWANSFNPQFFARSQSGEAFKPETGEQFEVGVKQDFLEGRLSTTLALFHLTRSNVLTTDPNNPDFSIQTGEQVSKGVELDINGEILPGWNVIANYAYIDAFVSKDNSLPEGDRLVNVPKHSASLWTTYQIQKGDLQGLGFGLGLVYVDDREARLPNTIQIPSYLRADASIFYRRNNLRAAINFKNLFDTRYYSSQGFYITPQPPLTIVGSLSWEF